MQLCQVTPFICFSQYEALIFKTALSLAFFGILRISKLSKTISEITLLNTPGQSCDPPYIIECIVLAIL